MIRQNIFIVGLMAVGKSTVGRLLAESLDMPFYDSDTEIEVRAGAEISWIFDVEGESGFREREEHVIDDLTQLEGVVLATGGGVVKSALNRQHLAARGKVIHLHCPLKRLLERTHKDRKRPLLQGNNRETVLVELMREREPLYNEIADYRFESNEQSAKQLVHQIVRRLEQDRVIC